MLARTNWIDDFKQLPLQQQSLLLFQGDNDDTVDGDYNPSAIREKFPDTAIVMLAGARHHLANEKDSIRGPLFQQITDYLASGSSADYDGMNQEQ